MPRLSEWLASASRDDAALEPLREVLERLQQNAPQALGQLDKQAEAELLQERAASGGWLSANLARIAIIVVGGAVGVMIALGLGSDWFFDRLASTSGARGLITFLVALGTVISALIIVLAVFWMPAAEVERRAQAAKDILTIMVGILGTIIGFYFGTAEQDAPAEPERPAVTKPAPQQ